MVFGFSGSGLMATYLHIFQEELKCLWFGCSDRIITLDYRYNSTLGSGGQVKHLHSIYIHHPDSTIPKICQICFICQHFHGCKSQTLSFHPYFRWTKTCGLFSTAMSLLHPIKITLIPQYQLIHRSYVNFPDVLTNTLFEKNVALLASGLNKVLTLYLISMFLN